MGIRDVETNNPLGTQGQIPVSERTSTHCCVREEEPVNGPPSRGFLLRRIT